MPTYDTSVIIATTLEPSRTNSLARAVDSILSQAGCAAIPLIIVNGNRFDPEALSHWRRRRDVRLFQLEEAHQIKSRLHGRRQVETDFFAVLDDDDIFLPRGLTVRRDCLRADSALDLVVGNGVIERDGHESAVLSQLDLHRRSPLLGLAVENWLASCAATFRTASIGVAYFEPFYPAIEWTARGFALVADGHKIAFLEDLTYRIGDTPRSLSKAPDYALRSCVTMRRLLDQPMPPDARRAWRRKYGMAEHEAAAIHLANGEMWLAFRAHCRSLREPGGRRYLLFTRKLLAGGFKARRRRLPAAS